MRILVVAPDVKLPKAQEEAQHVINTHPGSHLVSGKVTTGQLLDAIRGRDFDALWFICHANEAGLDLGGMHRYGADVLAQMARRTSARLLFLNACSTRAVAERIFATTQIPVVCTKSDVMDEDSLIAGRWFADELAGGRNYREAFAASRLDDFILIDGDGRIGPHMPAVQDQVYRNRDRLWELAQKIDKLEGSVSVLTDRDKENDRSLNTLKIAVGFLILLVGIVLVLNILNFYTIQSVLAGMP